MRDSRRTGSTLLQQTIPLRRVAAAALALALLGAPAAALVQPAPATRPATRPAQPRNDGSTPVAREDADGRFMRMHKENLERHTKGPVDLLFLGDSITAGWLSRGKPIWETKYAPLNAANFGIGGDRTENILWRIQQGELDNIKPKVVVLMIGTNNSFANTPAQIAAATGKILEQVKTKLPGTRVLLVSMTPRGARTNSQGQQDDGVRTGTTVRETNKLTGKLADGDRVRWLDLTPVFTDAEGKPSSALLYDQLHPNAEGYAAWDKAMWPVLDEMLKAAPPTK